MYIYMQVFRPFQAAKYVGAVHECVVSEQSCMRGGR